MLDNIFLRYAQTCRKLNKNSAWANKKHSYCYTISCSKTQHLHTTLDHGPPRPSPWLHQPITPSPSNSHINHIIQANKHPNPHTRWTACSLFAASTGNPFVIDWTQTARARKQIFSTILTLDWPRKRPLGPRPRPADFEHQNFFLFFFESRCYYY